MGGANALYYGDNLSVLRESIATESVDLIYLDPPFNSSASYNVLFKAPGGEQSAAQIEAFDDTWHWNESAERAFDDVVTGPHSDAAIMLRAMRSALGENDMMAYLAMMAVRLIEMHRVLKPTGSLYLHCDPTASHYLKIILDAVFEPVNFRSEIIWKRTFAHGSAKRWGDVHDTIFHYSRNSSFTWNRVLQQHDESYVEDKYRFNDSRGRYRLVVLTAPGVRHGESGKPWEGYDPTSAGRHWAVPSRAIDSLRAEGIAVPDGLQMQLDLLLANDYVRIPQKRDGSTGVPEFKLYLDPGQPIQDVVLDIPPLNSQAQERLGYPTQKPVALLERIICASSNEGEVVLDPFCGCGTTVHAAQKLGRKWIGIDVTHLSIGLIERRLRKAFPAVQFEVHGVPRDHAGATDLAERDKYEFQKWIVAAIDGQPYKGGRKGMDRGIDGYLHFRDADRKPQFAIISVKGGGTKSGDVRDLKGTIEREKAALGLFLTLNEPSREMEREAVAAGFYETGGRKFPRLQILTAADVLAGKRPQVPFGHVEGYKAAQREAADSQADLF
ncbi:MAG: modification methylase EcaI [Caulobacteraceae bacterium]|nr:modification methylase EcaI [Caulobacteraceae bacterium]